MSTARRIFTTDAKFAVSPREAGKPVTLAGYAIVWNVLSSDRGGYQVRLMPSSAKFETPTYALADHDFGKVLGSTANNTLRLLPDDFGVRVEIDLPDTTHGNDIATLVSRGDVSGMSFSMSSMPDGNVIRENGIEVFEATSFSVDEVTITAIPAFTETSIAVSPSKFSAIRDAARHMHSQQQKFDEIRLAMLAV